MPMIGNRQRAKSSAGRHKGHEIDWSKTSTTEVSIVRTTKVKKRERQHQRWNRDLGLLRHAGAPFTHTCLLPVVCMEPSTSGHRKDAN